MRTLKNINVENKISHNYFLVECEFCHEVLICNETDVNKYINIPKFHTLKCCNCGHYIKYNPEKINFRECDQYGNYAN